MDVEEMTFRMDGPIEMTGLRAEYSLPSVGDVGACQLEKPLSPSFNFFEVLVVDAGESACIGVGLAPQSYPLRRQPGWNSGSIGYHADDGKLFSQNGMGEPFGHACTTGDRMGCGIEYDEDDHPLNIFFTKNGVLVGKRTIPFPPTGLFPTVGLHSPREVVEFCFDLDYDSFQFLRRLRNASIHWESVKRVFADELERRNKLETVLAKGKHKRMKLSESDEGSEKMDVEKAIAPECLEDFMITFRDKKGRSFLQIMAEMDVSDPIKSFVKLDARAKKQLDISDELGTPIFIALGMKNMRAFNAFFAIQRNEIAKLEDENGRSLLHIAASLDLRNTCEELLKCGCSVSKIDRFGRMPLEIAQGSTRDLLQCHFKSSITIISTLTGQRKEASIASIPNSMEEVRVWIADQLSVPVEKIGFIWIEDAFFKQFIGLITPRQIRLSHTLIRVEETK